MPKGNSSLTGGSGDVNPQWYKLPLALNATLQTPVSGQVFVTAQVPNPVSRLKQTGNKTMVLEVLKVRWGTDIILLNNFSMAQITWNGYVLTASGPNPSSAQGRCIDWLDQHAVVIQASTVVSGGEPFSFSAVNNGALEDPVVHDLTDGAGHGVLVATDQITLMASLTLTDLTIGLGGSPVAAAYPDVPSSGAWSVFCEILYRFKEITDKEWIGIVQSQQNNS